VGVDRQGWCPYPQLVRVPRERSRLPLLPLLLLLLLLLLLPVYSLPVQEVFVWWQPTLIAMWVGG
jgi:hypothetical protein